MAEESNVGSPSSASGGSEQEPTKKKVSAAFRAKKFFGSRLSESKLGRKAIGNFLGAEGQYLILQLKLITRQVAGRIFAREQKKKLLKLLVKVALLYNEGYINQADGESLLLPLLYLIDGLISLGALAEQKKLHDGHEELKRLLEQIEVLHNAVLKVLQPLMKEKNSAKWTDLLNFYGGKDFITRLFTDASLKKYKIEVMRMVQRLRELVVEVMRAADMVPDGYNEDYVNQARELCAYEGCLKPRARPLNTAIEGLDIDEDVEGGGEGSVRRIRYCIEHQNGLAVKVRTRPTFELFFKTDYHRPVFVRFLSENPQIFFKHLRDVGVPKGKEEDAAMEVGTEDDKAATDAKVGHLLRFFSEVDNFKSINGKGLLTMRAEKILEKYLVGDGVLRDCFPKELLHSLPVTLLEATGATDEEMGNPEAAKRRKVVSASIFDAFCDHLEEALRRTFESFLSSQLFQTYVDSLLPADEDGEATKAADGSSVYGRKGKNQDSAKASLNDKDLSSDDEEIIDTKLMKRLRAGTLL